MFAVREIVFQVKTKGIVEEYLPLDIDWELNTYPGTPNWTFALNTCQLQLYEKVKGKLSLIADSSLKNTSVGLQLLFKE